LLPNLKVAKSDDATVAVEGGQGIQEIQDIQDIVTVPVPVQK